MEIEMFVITLDNTGRIIYSDFRTDNKNINSTRSIRKPELIVDLLCNIPPRIEELVKPTVKLTGLHESTFITISYKKGKLSFIWENKSTPISLENVLELFNNTNYKRTRQLLELIKEWR